MVQRGHDRQSSDEALASDTKAIEEKCLGPFSPFQLSLCFGADLF